MSELEQEMAEQAIKMIDAAKVVITCARDGTLRPDHVNPIREAVCNLSACVNDAVEADKPLGAGELIRARE